MFISVPNVPLSVPMKENWLPGETGPSNTISPFFCTTLMTAVWDPKYFNVKSVTLPLHSQSPLDIPDGQINPPSLLFPVMTVKSPFTNPG